MSTADVSAPSYAFLWFITICKARFGLALIDYRRDYEAYLPNQDQRRFDIFTINNTLAPSFWRKARAPICLQAIRIRMRFDEGAEVREFKDATAVLQAILIAYAKGKTLFVSFVLDQEKIASKSVDWAERFGTRLQPWQRQDRHQKGLPTAIAVCGPVVGYPEKRELMLMSTVQALTAPPESPWRRETWKDRLPTYGPYVMVRECNRHNRPTWTWRLQESVFQGRANYMTTLVKQKKAADIHLECQSWLRVYALFGGVRRQFLRMLKSASRLWERCYPDQPWPGLQQEQVPALTSFRADKDSVERSSRT